MRLVEKALHLGGVFTKVMLQCRRVRVVQKLIIIVP